MIKQLDQKWFQTDYLNIKDDGRLAPGRITHTFNVLSRKDASLLGHIRWFAQWRQYCFFPLAGIVLDKKCMRELAEFCEDRTTAHKTPATVSQER